MALHAVGQIGDCEPIQWPGVCATPSRGYSSFAAARGDQAAAALTGRFIAIAERVLGESGGESLGNRGDEVLFAFESPRQAIQGAVAFDQALLDATREDPSLPMPAGVGIDVGEAVLVPDGWRANAINVAARLCSIAKGGEILATREVTHLAQAIEGISYLPQPPARLKGIPEAVAAMRIVADAGDPAGGFARLGLARAAAPPVPGPKRRRRAIAAATLLVAAAATIAGVLALGGGASSRSAVAADSVGAIVPAGDAVTADVPPGASPSSAASGDRAVWVANYSDGTVSRIDPATDGVSLPIVVGAGPSGIAVSADGVWVANSLSGTVSWINPTVNRVVGQPILVGNGPSGIAVGYGSVWVANSLDGTLSRINATTGSVLGAPIALGGSPSDVAAGFGAVWVSDEANGRVLRVDPVTGQVTQINVGTGPSAITVGYGSVWVTNSLDETVSRINPQTDEVAGTIPVGNTPNAIASGAGGVWVADEFGGAVVRIDPTTGAVAHRIGVGNSPRGLAIASGVVWVAAQAADTSHRGGTLTVLTQGPGNLSANGSLDPAVLYNVLIPLSNDGLTAFKRVGGSDGAQLVPDLAVSLPGPSDGGFSYTFQLRRGIRYSNGQPVRPEDFRLAIERDFKLGDPNATAFYRNLVGGTACVAHPARCDLTRGITYDDSAATVTFHLATPEPELLDWLALWDAVAVPAGTPTNQNVGQHPVPATGAYEVASATPKEIRLVRNPYFHEWSHAARPDGYPDQIIFKFGASPGKELTAVEQGTADYTLDSVPADRFTEVETRFPSQVHLNPASSVDALILNTRLAPFNDLWVRRALNYAVDRATTATFVGPKAQPTCQFLTPNIPGYRPYCPYTRNPTRGGGWTASDMTTAERLIAASHTRGMAITLWNEGGVYADAPGEGGYIVSLLDRLGYRATQRPDNTGRFNDSRTKAQLALVSFFPAYPAASQYIQWALSCNSFLPNSSNNPNGAEFCSQRLEDQINSALQAEETNVPSTPIWAQADKTVTDQAPLVPLDIPSTIDFVSRRVGNYQYSPQLGGLVLIDQLWVK
jgi:YVTN family beta-propeller protein